jgi:hypothetical protein
MSKEERIAPLLEEAINTRIRTLDLMDKIREIVLEEKEEDLGDIADDVLAVFLDEEACDGLPPTHGLELAEELLTKIDEEILENEEDE